jgi:hypothetical protein
LDNGAEEPKSKARRYLLSVVFFIAAGSFTTWYFLRYQTEKNTITRFFETLARGDLKQAYQLWRPSNTYTYDDFFSDWGPNGYYGTVKSFRIVAAHRPRGASGVIVVVEFSPEAPFPNQRNDRVKEVSIWVERRDQSLSFPP